MWLLLLLLLLPIVRRGGGKVEKCRGGATGTGTATAAVTAASSERRWRCQLLFCTGAAAALMRGAAENGKTGTGTGTATRSSSGAASDSSSVVRSSCVLVSGGSVRDSDCNSGNVGPSSDGGVERHEAAPGRHGG